MRPDILTKRLLAAAVFSALLLGLGLRNGAVAQGAQSDAGAADAATVKDFQERVAQYLEVHKEKGVIGKPTNSPDELQEHKQQAQEKVRESRPAARQGDIFTPRTGAYFKKQLAATLNGPDGPKVRASLRHAEPLPKVRLRVNERYPRNLPLQSTPPTLLLNLPRLPAKLQYRIVGPTLVLYDTAANLVVDFLPDAVPAP